MIREQKQQAHQKESRDERDVRRQAERDARVPQGFYLKCPDLYINYKQGRCVNVQR